jgi:hypothetical protein
MPGFAGVFNAFLRCFARGAASGPRARWLTGLSLPARPLLFSFFAPLSSYCARVGASIGGPLRQSARHLDLLAAKEQMGKCMIGNGAARAAIQCGPGTCGPLVLGEKGSREIFTESLCILKKRQDAAK